MNRFFLQFKKILALLLISWVFFSLINKNFVLAIGGAGDLWVFDGSQVAVTEKGKIQDTAKWSWEKALDELLKQTKKVFASTFHQTFRNMLATVAYDTATWLGSGAKGQSPMFIREGWGEYLTNVADNAAGEFIYQLGQNNGFLEFDMCDPGDLISGRIGLGLMNYARSGVLEGKCTFFEMKENWEEALNSENFLDEFQSMFRPGGSDISLSFNAYGKLIDKIVGERETARLKRTETGGWLNVEDLAGWQKNYPGYQATKANIPTALYSQQAFQYTEDGLIDAANIFINQLMLTLIQNLMSNIGGSSYTSSYDWDKLEGIFDAEADSYNGGIAGAEEQFRKIIQPKFNTRGDYNILAELSICIDPTHAGPTSCVIDDKFKQAIQEKVTIAEAIEKGYLNPSAVFGFKADGLEPSYMEAYPYRSMMILRKFRIIPVGWEVASQYIKENMGATTADEKGIKTLDDVLICFSNSDKYKDDETCKDDGLIGLVDPNWVLKAPQNYCKREGPGGFISSQSVTGEKENSELVVNRDTDYCADEQACILEYDDGSCEAYGYCTKEDRAWNFDAESCEDIYHSCDSFKSKEKGNSFYLRSTLDYGISNDESDGCNANNVGCLDYCEDYDVSTDSFTCSENNGNKLHIDNNAKDCSESSEACHEFLRLENSETNLVNYSSESEACEDNNEALFGDCVTEASSDSGFGQSLNLENSDFLYGTVMTFSLYVKNCSDIAKISLGTNVSVDSESENISSSNVYSDINPAEWTRLSVTHYFEAGSSVDMKFLNFDTVADAENDLLTSGKAVDSCIIDGIKLEIGSQASDFSIYGQDSLVYEKLLPKYLESDCYENNIYVADDPNTVDENEEKKVDYKFKEDAPSECSNFARRCSKDEHGCNLYTAKSDGMTVPAKVNAFDYCSAECVGYDDYLQTESPFESSKLSFFIPDKASKCNIDAVGCSEFTNLDKLDQGAEAIEYYSELRQCVDINNDDENDGCEVFYLWEGSDESGYQLKTHQLKTENEVLKLTEEDTACSEDIFNLPATDPAYNPDCREFYSSDGTVAYANYKKTITCSDNCHPYRKTDDNIIKDAFGVDLVSDDACVAGQNGIPESAIKIDDNQNLVYEDGKCVYCKNGGVWNADHQACIYMAIPQEGKSCNASQNKCLEYSGNNGNNTRILVNDDFEQDSVSDWQVYNCDFIKEVGKISLSNESLLVDQKSLKIEGSNTESCYFIGKKINVKKDKTYSLKFLAKASEEIETDIFYSAIWDITDSDNKSIINLFSSDVGSPDKISYSIFLDWQEYEVIINNSSLESQTNNNIILGFTVSVPTTEDKGINKEFYLDNIRLTEISERYYLIKDSWNTPEACFTDIIGRPVSETYNLGCAVYTDQNNKVHNLRKFSGLCDESAVGCELMIDTRNYSQETGKVWNLSADSTASSTASSTACADDIDCEEVKENNYTYVVYDDSKKCNESDKGCQKLGKPNVYLGDTTEIVYEEVYKINNPDTYDDPNGILCNMYEIGCQEWSSDKGKEYFKDPGVNICQWGWDGSEYNWYNQVKKCGGDGDFCLSNNDCSGEECSLAEKTKCNVDSSNSICADVDQPTEMVGICDASAEGCVEYSHKESDNSECSASSEYACSYRIEDDVTTCTLKKENECENFIHSNFSVKDTYCTNELLKVRPDRVCSEFLACETFVESTPNNKECYDIGVCTKLDPDTGLCEVFEEDDVPDESEPEPEPESSFLLELSVEDKEICNGNKDSDGWVQVSNCEELQDIGVGSVDTRFSSLSGKYYLKNDDGVINCSGIANFDPIGGSNSSKHFKGEFNGCNYEIYNLKINNTTESYLGLFSYLEGANVRNTGISEGSYVIGESFLGGIVGGIYHTIISNVYNKGNISGSQAIGGTFIGGIVGYLSDSTIKSSYNKGNISGYVYIGGIVGELLDSTINSLYNAGNITARDGGGIVGNLSNSTINDSYNIGNINNGQSSSGISDFSLNSTINNSYNKGSLISSNESWSRASGISPLNKSKVNNSYNVGNLDASNTYSIGNNYEGATITNSYCYGDSCEDGDGVIAEDDVTAFYDQDHQVYSGWDFVNTWQTCENGFPILKGAGSQTCDSQTTITIDITTNNKNNFYDIDNDLNRTGYSLLGHKDFFSDANPEYAYYHLGDMEQVGEYIEFSNGSFEISGSNGYPAGWNVISKTNSWDKTKMYVIDNPYEAEQEGIDYPVDGKSILKYSPSQGNLESDYISVKGGEVYAISFYINTINLISNGSFLYIDLITNDGEKDDSGYMGIENSYNGANHCVGQDTDNHCTLVGLKNSNNWVRKEIFVKLKDHVKKIKLDIGGSDVTGYSCKESDDCFGNVYFDDFRIEPQLKTKKIKLMQSSVNEKTHLLEQTEVITNNTQANDCRLYPANNSLACKYREDSGIMKKGWPGYCLQYDRYPGDPNVCLLWYPLDRVAGDGYDEGAGYSDRYPLYYCLSATNENVNTQELPVTNYFYISVDQSAIAGTGSSKESDAWFYPKDDMFFYPADKTDHDAFCSKVSKDTDRTMEEYALEFFEYWINITGADPNVYKYHSYEIDSAINGGFGKHDEVDCDCLDSVKYGTCEKDGSIFVYKINITSSSYCTQITQVVNASGQNKYWSGRVYEGSTFETACNISEPATATTIKEEDEDDLVCKYTSDYSPFGAIVPPSIEKLNISSNPYEWDGREKIDGYQPLAHISKNNVDFSQNSGFGEPRMGQIYYVGTGNNLKSIKKGSDGKTIINDLRGLFAQNYATWDWSGGECSDDNSPCGFDKDCQDDNESAYCEGARYQKTNSVNWSVPTKEGDKSNNSYTKAKPRVLDCYLINSNNGFTNLIFNVDVDVQQSPIVRYSVDWTDGTKTVVSGVELNDRYLNTFNDPADEITDKVFSLFHYYKGGIKCVEGGTEDCPIVTVLDNWEAESVPSMCNNFTEARK